MGLYDDDEHPALAQTPIHCPWCGRALYAPQLREHEPVCHERPHPADERFGDYNER